MLWFDPIYRIIQCLDRCVFLGSSAPIHLFWSKFLRIHSFREHFFKPQDVITEMYSFKDRSPIVESIKWFSNMSSVSFFCFLAFISLRGMMSQFAVYHAFLCWSFMKFLGNFSTDLFVCYKYNSIKNNHGLYRPLNGWLYIYGHIFRIVPQKIDCPCILTEAVLSDTNNWITIIQLDPFEQPPVHANKWWNHLCSDSCVYLHAFRTGIWGAPRV